MLPLGITLPKDYVNEGAMAADEKMRIDEHYKYLHKETLRPLLRFSDSTLKAGQFQVHPLNRQDLANTCAKIEDKHTIRVIPGCQI